jgi:hypothetical protein
MTILLEGVLHAAETEDMLLLLLEGALRVAKSSEEEEFKNATQKLSSLLHRCCNSRSRTSEASATSTSIPAKTRASAQATSSEYSSAQTEEQASAPSRCKMQSNGVKSISELSKAESSAAGFSPGVAGSGLKSRYLESGGKCVKQLFMRGKMRDVAIQSSKLGKFVGFCLWFRWWRLCRQ